MKALVMSLSLLALFGCEGSKDDLQQYVMEVKARKVAVVQDVPEIQAFEHLAYQANESRNPFISPLPEAAEAVAATEKECSISPNFDRNKQPLEQFSLASLTMRGVLGDGPDLWALIDVPGGELHRVRTGDFIGLHNGVITKVSQLGLDIQEVVSDGQGCWIQRDTQLLLSKVEQ